MSTCRSRDSCTNETSATDALRNVFLDTVSCRILHTVSCGSDRLKSLEVLNAEFVCLLCFNNSYNQDTDCSVIPECVLTVFDVRSVLDGVARLFWKPYTVMKKKQNNLSMILILC